MLGRMVGHSFSGNNQHQAIEMAAADLFIKING